MLQNDKSVYVNVDILALNKANAALAKPCLLKRSQVHIIMILLYYDDVIKLKRFRVTGPLWGESTDHWWIPLHKGQWCGALCFLWSAPERTFEQTVDTPVIWDAIGFIMTSL